MGSTVRDNVRERSQSATQNSSTDEQSEESFTAAPLVNVGVFAALARVRPERRRQRLTFTDGPFTESKELIGGYRPPNAARR